MTTNTPRLNRDMQHLAKATGEIVRDVGDQLNARIDKASAVLAEHESMQVDAFLSLCDNWSKGLGHVDGGVPKLTADGGAPCSLMLKSIHVLTTTDPAEV